MRIERLILDQVGCFDHLDISFPEGRDPDKADIHLLVGANGTGKSTILMAMAQFFSAVPTGIQERFSHVQGCLRLGYSACGYNRMAAIAPSSGAEELLGATDDLYMVGEWRGEFAFCFFEMETPAEAAVKAQTTVLKDYRNKTERYLTYLPTDPARELSFAAFAYNGRRSIDARDFTGIVDENRNLLLNACVAGSDGEGAAGGRLLVHWVANTLAKAAFALQQGDEARSSQYSNSVERVERAIGSITGWDFQFVLTYEPLGVRASIGGVGIHVHLLPDGFKSLISWIGDLLMRLDRLPWVDARPVTEREIILFLDEIEVHLHPAWQRRILPIVQTLFPNAQVFVSTHSPFVIASADDAWIYPLYLDEKGKGHVGEILPSMLGNSYATVLRDVLGIEEEFAPQVQEPLKEFYRLRDDALKGDADAFARLKAKERELAAFGEEVLAVVRPEMRQVERRLSRQVAEPD
ncbi:AAA family ATPase [Thiohalocapsa sp. ML1]|uniref:AAA family ATPase n=1 Tax=Thiohalocapsa sp. ML1 TaxID=1431688 RepID=UPI000B2200F3|nr:ATP-binding protein [Thiohalocapsa sp. ML1]